MLHAAAQRISVFTIDFPDPSTINYDNNKFNTIDDSASFQYRITSNIQTLSTKGVDAGSDPYGILYVPDLDTDECKNAERDGHYVPVNATRLADLPPDEPYALIAVAPWFKPQCVIEYFAAARKAPTKAMFVYLPDQGNAKPPVLNDAAWNLTDGGSWQQANTFPTYALSSITGDNIMDQLALYSGNLTDVPYGDELAQIFAPTDYIRLWASVSTDSGGQLPSLWVFLVIVLAILIVAVSSTSIAMHIIQRRRRSDLRRRVIQGEVDLEAIGVKRLKVSQGILDKLPIYTYTGGTSDPEKSRPQTPAPTNDLSASNAETVMTQPAQPSTVPATLSGTSTTWSQPTCPICLDDFEWNETKVRELPCRHIFHPDCIDQFLLRNSSLCPMCKQSVLPTGACPVEITNMMVRRERHIARMRARGLPVNNGQSSTDPSSSATDSTLPTSRRPGAFGLFGNRLGGALSGRRIFNGPERAHTRPADIEMADAATTQQPNGLAASPTQPIDSTSLPQTQTNSQNCSPTHNRREWARQRAMQLLGNRHIPSDVDEEEQGPRWRRTLRKAFPGFR